VPIPSRVLGSGVNSLSTIAICGDGNGSVTAAGTSAGDATAVTYVYNNVTTVVSGAGIKLPQTEQGETITIVNSGANVLTVYPYDTASTINGAANSELLPGGSCIYSATSNTSWVTLQGYQQLPKKRYGSFYDNTIQTATSADTAYAVVFATTAAAYGVSIGSPASRIVVADTGVYDFQFSAQCDKTSGGDAFIYFWPRINGTDVPDSASFFRLKGNDAELVPSWNFMLPMAAGQYFELMWSTSDTSVQLLAATAASIWPGIPSVILTVNEVSL
jgi:hypothetical protein